MLICINKKTGEVVPDFQSSATPGTLIKNAVNAGLGVAEDFEEQDVEKEVYQSHVDAFMELKRPESEAAELDEKNTLKSVKKKLKDLGLTDKEIKTLFRYAS